MRQGVAVGALAIAVACGSGSGGNGTGPTGTAPATGTPTGTTTGAATPGPTVPTFVGDPPKNLIFISVDTLRKDHLSRYDPEHRNLTPFLDGLMDEGFVLDDHQSCSNWTLHAVSCATGGLDPMDEGYMPRLLPAVTAPWPEGSRFLADELRDAGYWSTLSSANAWLGPAQNVADGYDETFSVTFASAQDVIDTGLAAFDGRPTDGSADRWFAHFHFIEPHIPYDPPAEYRVGEDAFDPVGWDLTQAGDTYSAVFEWGSLTPEEQANLEGLLRFLYGGEAQWIDAQIANLWGQLQARGMLDDALVMFWTDHGEQFWERGTQSHGWSLAHEENDGVWFLWAPNLVAGASSSPTIHQDVAVTALRLLDVPVPARMTGMFPGEIPDDRVRFAGADGKVAAQSVRVGDKQLIFEWVGRGHYYDRGTDPDQLDDRYDPADPDVVALWDLLRPEVAQMQALMPDRTAVPPDGLSL